jgi:hypothetical protein
MSGCVLPDLTKNSPEAFPKQAAIIGFAQTSIIGNAGTAGCVD